MRLGASLGMGWLERASGAEPGALAGAFEVEVAGERHAVEVQTAPFYDPSGARMRS